LNKLRAIRIFVAIAKYGSLTETSKQLGKSLPTVVRTLSSLEDELGFRLFNRTTRRIALTHDGEVYLSHCVQMLDEMSEIESQLQGHTKSPEGNVKIAAPVLFGETAVAPVLFSIMELNPGLKFDVNFADRNIDIIEEHIDIAVRISDLNDSSLMAKKVGTVRQVFCASPAFLAKYGMPLVPADLDQTPCIHYNGINAGIDWQFERDLQASTKRPQAQFRSNTNTANVQACIHGVGIGCFYGYQIADHVRSGKLLVLLEQFETTPVPVSLVYPHTRLVSPRVRFVLDALQDGLKRALTTELALMPQ